MASCSHRRRQRSTADWPPLSRSGHHSRAALATHCPYDPCILPKGYIYVYIFIYNVKIEDHMLAQRLFLNVGYLLLALSLPATLHSHTYQLNLLKSTEHYQLSSRCPEKTCCHTPPHVLQLSFSTVGCK